MERREYAACIHKKRSPEIFTVDKDFLETIKQEAMVLPLFEDRIHKYKYTKNYSLTNNEMLKCRWTDFVNIRMPRIPFKIPTIKDLHFFHGTVVLDPKATVNNRINYRFHLRSGPDIDKFGQLPIPDEANIPETRKSARMTRQRGQNILVFTDLP